MSSKPLLSPIQGHTVLPQAVKKPRLPFSRLRCVWHPRRSNNGEVCEPFAKLTVLVCKASGILQCDVVGIADPYVTLSLNNGKPEHWSLTKRRTLAPEWQEMFELDVYHPSSILTVDLYDKEFGGGNLAEFLGLDDRHAGWVDIRLGVLPMNEWVAGWFEIGHPKHHMDTLQSRIKHPVSARGETGGRIQLHLRLTVNSRFDEFFAWCLPQPTYGHDCSFELKDLIRSARRVTLAAEKWVDDVGNDFDWLLQYGIASWCVLVGLVWKPDLVLPALLIMLPMTLVYMTYKFRNRLEEEGLVQDKTRIIGALAEEGSDTRLADGTEAATCPRSRQAARAKAIHVTKKQVENAKNMEEFDAQLDRAMHILPKHIKKDMQKAAEGMDALVFFVQSAERMAAETSSYTVICLGILAVTIAASLALFWTWQPFLIQILVSVGISISLWPHTIPYRLCKAISSCVRPSCHRIPPSYAGRYPSRTEAAAVRSIITTQVKYLGVKDEGSWKEQDGCVLGHERSACVFGKPTWCDECGTLFSLLDPKGIVCKACYRTMCTPCAATENTGEQCPGPCHTHSPEMKTFLHATWCNDCGMFLWGTKHQGCQCTKCSWKACRQCASIKKRAPMDV